MVEKMEEIRTRIDVVFDFVASKRRTTFRELSREFKLKREDLERYTSVLSKYGLIKVKYGWFDTYLYTEENIVQLIDEFKSLLYVESANEAVTFDNDIEVTDKNLKITALRSILTE